jgi:GT2 family glycosyltransferase
MPEDPHVAVIVCNWNDHEETLGCLELLAGSDWPNLSVVAVDNGSVEPLEPMVTARGIEATVVRNETNRGFAGGMNAGMRRALELDADYVFLLNNDTRFDASLVPTLVAAARQHPDTGILSPLEFFRDEPEIISSAGLRCDLRRGYQGPPIGVGQRDHGQFNGLTRPDVSSGTAMFVPTDVVREVGLLDEEFFCVIEDVDWALRMREAGREIYVSPEARLWHGVGTSFGGEDSPLVTYYRTRNSFFLVTRHLPLPWPRALYRHVEILGANLLAALRHRRKPANLRAVFAGWRDYRRGRLGPHPDSIRPKPD